MILWVYTKLTCHFRSGIGKQNNNNKLCSCKVSSTMWNADGILGIYIGKNCTILSQLKARATKYLHVHLLQLFTWGNERPKSNDNESQVPTTNSRLQVFLVDSVSLYSPNWPRTQRSSLSHREILSLTEACLCLQSTWIQPQPEHFFHSATEDNHILTTCVSRGYEKLTNM